MLHCIEASSLMISSLSEENLPCQIKLYREEAIEYSQMAENAAKIAYGDSSNEMKIFHEISFFCQNSSNNVLLSEIQNAVIKLRDIDL